jgi:hypothetical protein
MMDKLLELAARCEAAVGPDNWLSADIGVAFDIPGDKCPHYTSSLDAAMTLVPGSKHWMIQTRFNGYHAEVAISGTDAVTPALALCAAALRARAVASEQNV